MSEIKYTELDFQQIKENLKNFLKSQSQFKDYDFDGSSLSILLDVLAYNTSYNAFYLNMLASEMFLDSAYLRQNVVSRAKHLGYTPRSVKTLSAIVNITRTYPDPPNTPGQVLLQKKDSFYTIGVDGNRYSYTPKESVYMNKINSTTFYAKNVELIQGKRMTHTWVVEQSGEAKQRFCIPNKNVDTSSITVIVRPSTASTAIDTYLPFQDLTQLNPSSKIYFLQEYSDKMYEVIFGDDILGNSPKPGNLVSIEYVVSDGEASFGAKVFKVSAWVPPDDFVNTTRLVPEIKIDIVSPAKDYVESESIESIKFLAPKSYTTQNRAVTKNDYETILRRDVPQIEHIRVWGGEENDPPYYGRVFCSIKPRGATTFNIADKKRIMDAHIRSRSVLSIEPVIVDPEYIGMTINTTVNVFSHKTKLGVAEIKALVTQKIKDYAKTTLIGFDSDFRYSKLLSIIDGIDFAIESNLTDVRIKYKVFPPFDVAYNQTIQLNNSIDTGDFKNFRPAVTSSEFVFNNVDSKIADDGSGTLFIYCINNGTFSILNPNVGFVDYSKGKITISNLLIDTIRNNINYLDLYIKPRENDIITLRNQILLLEDDDITVNVVDLNTIKLS